MWKIIGICPATGKRVEIATAENPTEREMILSEEKKNSRRVYSVRIV